MGWRDVLHIGLGKYIQARKVTGREKCCVGLNKLLEGLPGEKKSQGEERRAQARRNGSWRDKKIRIIWTEVDGG